MGSRAVFIWRIKDMEGDTTESAKDVEEEPPRDQQQEAQEPSKERNQETEDPSLDIASKEFDPLKVLYNSDLRVCTDKLRVQYQNFAEFESVLKRKGIYELNKPLGKKTPAQQDANKPSTSKAMEQGPQAIASDNIQHGGRRFLPHQMPIKSVPRSRIRAKRNLINHMGSFQGCLGALNRYVLSGARVVVTLRNHLGVRGQTEGQLLLFDKHWNMLLKEVKQQWQRRKYKYGESKVCGDAQDCTQRLRALGLWDLVNKPPVEVKSLNRKNVCIYREFPQLFIRGEQVVMVRGPTG